MLGGKDNERDVYGGGGRRAEVQVDGGTQPLRRRKE